MHVECALAADAERSTLTLEVSAHANKSSLYRNRSLVAVSRHPFRFSASPSHTLWVFDLTFRARRVGTLDSVDRRDRKRQEATLASTFNCACFADLRHCANQTYALGHAGKLLLEPYALRGNHQVNSRRALEPTGATLWR